MRKTIVFIILIVLLMQIGLVLSSCKKKENPNENVIEDVVGYYEEVPKNSGIVIGVEESGDISMTFDKKTGTLTITGEGSLLNFFPWADYYEVRDVNYSIKYIEIGEGIENIVNSFNYCYGLREIRFPESALICRSFDECTSLKNVDASFVKNIGASFQNCSKLKEVKVHNVDSSFYNCSSLKKVISNGDSVCDSFIKCERLETVILDEGLKYANRSFTGCPLLKQINCGDKQYTPEKLDQYFHDPDREEHDYNN